MAPGAAIERLIAPGAIEAYSRLTGACALGIDLSAGEPSDAEIAQSGVESALRGLAQLPCPSVGYGVKRAGALGRALAPTLDVVVDTRAAALEVLTRIGEQPASSAALVELLRMGEGLDIHSALVAESLVYSTQQSGPDFARWIAGRSPRALPIGRATHRPAMPG